MGVEKCRDMLVDVVMGRNNGAARVIGFVDFREEIEGGGARIRDMKERDVKGGEILCGTNGGNRCLCVSVPFVISSIPGKSFHFPFP